MVTLGLPLEPSIVIGIISCWKTPFFIYSFFIFYFEENKVNEPF